MPFFRSGIVRRPKRRWFAPSRGAVVRSITLTGTLATAGTVTEQPQRRLTGTLAPTGAVVQQVQRRLTATLTTAGALLKQAQRRLTATLTTAGAGTFTLPGTLPFRDDFTGSINASWTETDSQGALAASSTRAVFTRDDDVDVWTDPALVSLGYSRSGIGAFVALVRLTNNASGAGKGFKLALSPSSSNPDAAGAATITHQYPNLHTSRTDEFLNLNRQRSIDYTYAVVPRPSGGFWHLVSAPQGANSEWAEWPDASIIGVSGTATDATLYGHLAARQFDAEVDYAALVTTAALPTPLTSRFGPSLASEASGTRTAGTSSLTDCTVPPRITEAILSRGANNDTRAVICFRGSNSSYANCWKFKGEFDRFSLHNTSGVQTQNGGATMPASTNTHMMVVDTGDRIDCYVDGVRRLTWNSTTGASNTFAGTACDTGASLSVTVTDYGAWRDVTLNDNLGPPPAPPTGRAITVFSDTFTLANGTNLSGQNGWTAAGGMGSWEAQGNQARITAGATTGILYRSSGIAGVNPEIQADITLPSTTDTYPIDWFAGVIVRYTDANNFIQARYLYQNNSPEVEVWEYVAGAGDLIGYVNLGAGALATSSTHTLKLAALNSQVGAWHDGELVVQATTTVLTGSNVGIGVFDNNPFGQPTWDNVVVRPAGAVTYPVSLSGTLSTAGVLVKTRTKTLAGTLASAGVLVKQIGKALAASVTTTGALVKQEQKRPAGTLGLSGAVSTNIQAHAVSLAGTLTTAGAVVRQAQKRLGGALTTAGAVFRQNPSRTFGGTVGLAGSIGVAKLKLVSISGTLTTSGATSVTRIKSPVSLGATLTLTGALATERILAPIPAPPEGTPVAEVTLPEAVLTAEVAAPGAGAAVETGPPEFDLRS